MTEVKKLRQANNKTIVEGILVEKKLEIKDYNRKDKDGNTFTDKGITGTVHVRTGENEVHEIRLFSYKTKADGKENGNYKGYVTIMNEAISQADVAEGKGEVASNVRVQGSLGLNEYYTATEELRAKPQISGLFVNRLDTEPTPTATFDIEIIIKNVLEEVNKDGDATGRALVNGFLPLFNSVVPMSFVVGEGGADYVLNNFEQGMSVNVWGRMTNFRKVTQIITPSGFGEDKVDEKVEFLNELEITGGTVIDEDNENAFDLDLLKTALQAREVYLAGKLKESKEKAAADSAPKADGFSGGNAGAAKKNKPTVSVDNMFG